MKVDKGIFVYESYRTSYEIDSLSIRKVAIYKKKRRTVSYFFMLSDGFTISTDEISDKSISILDSLPLIEKEKIDLRVPFKTVIKRLFILLKEFIRKEYKNILLVLFGLVITALSFILYLNGTLNGIPLIISLILAFIYGIGHIYYTYIRRLFNDMTKLSRIVFSIIVSIVFLVIVFVINIILFMLFMKKHFSINYLYYSIFLLPSFTIVVVVMVLLLIALSYS